MKIVNGTVSALPRRKAEPYQIKAKADRAEIYIYDTIGDSWDGTTGKQFAADLKALGDVSALDIYINSPGGSVFDGISIYNVLIRHKARKMVCIDGLAASIASVIAMAGDEIVIAENGMMMIHDPWGIAAGGPDDFRRMADMLDKVKGTILDTYVRKTGGDADEIERMMSAETWMTAQEAVDKGFCDRTTEPVEMAAMTKHDLTGFKHVPEPLAVAIEPDVPAEDTPAVVPEVTAEVVEENPAATSDEGADEWTPGEPHPKVALAAARLKRRNLVAGA